MKSTLTAPRRAAAVDPHSRRPISRGVTIRAGFDNAETNEHNVHHWKKADGLSAAAANSYAVRKILRERARYERDNNGFLKGMQRTLVKDLIGRGPRLQMNSGDRAADRLLERLFRRWLKATRFAKRLRTGRKAKGVDGEAFMVRVSNPRLRNPVKTSILWVEADLFEDPRQLDDVNRVGGITFDPDTRDPLTYMMLRQHPGDIFAGWNLDADELRADDVVHWFDEDRPGQVRGISEHQSGMGLFGQLRRWTLAVLSAAELAADHAAVLETQATPFDDEGEPQCDDLDPFDSVDVDRGMLTTLPRGWKMNQFKAEQPQTTFESFRNACVDEAGRGEGMPSNKARGNSSGYNYASGRLDNQDWYELVDVERDDMSEDVLDPALRWWATEARLVHQELGDLDPQDLPDHNWYFDGHPHADESKHAAAVTVMIGGELLAQDDYLLAEGIDPESHWEKIREQRKRAAELAKIGPGPAALASPNVPAPAADEDDE